MYDDKNINSDSQKNADFQRGKKGGESTADVESGTEETKIDDTSESSNMDQENKTPEMSEDQDLAK